MNTGHAFCQPFWYQEAHYLAIRNIRTLKASKLDKLRIALDWTPNTNHTGFFVARRQEFYRAENIELEIVDPSIDNYQKTPAKKLELDEVDFAIAPSETVLSYNTKKRPLRVKAIAAILKTDASAIVSLENSDIERPADLPGKVYGSYQARYEDKIVQQMVRNDGGDGDFQIIYPEKLGIWNTLINGKCDATWIFRPWEGVEAEGREIALRYFKLKDYGIPYGYSPVIIAKSENIESQSDLYRRFMRATRKGFEFAQQLPAESVRILAEFVSAEDLQNIELLKSQEEINLHMQDDLAWGKMKTEKWIAFVSWLKRFELIDPHIEGEMLFTNELLEKD